MAFHFGLTLSDGKPREPTAASSSPSLFRSSPAPSDSPPPTGSIAFSFGSRSPSTQTPTGSIFTGVSPPDAARSSSDSGRPPLFRQSSSNPATPFAFQCLSPAHPPVPQIFGAPSADAHQGQGSGPQSRRTSDIFSPAGSSTGGAALSDQSSSRAESVSSSQNNNALFGGTSRNDNTSRATTPQNNSSFVQPSRQSSGSRVSSPQNSSAANTPSTHTSGALLFGASSSIRGLRFPSSPPNIFGPRSNTSSPLPSPSWPASSSTTSSGPRIPAPRNNSRSLFSASATNLSWNASPSPTSRSPSVDQLQVRQSIEQQDDAPATSVSFQNRRPATRSSTPQTLNAHDQIPQVSLSLPEQDRGSVVREMAQLSLFTPIIPASSSAATPRRSYTSNSTETDMNMSPMTAALNNLDNDRSAPGLITPGPGSPSPVNVNNARRRGVPAEPHNVRDETPPDDRFNAVTFQNALGDARRLMGELANVLGGGALHREPESVMSRLHAQAQRLSGFECPSRRKIGFVGDSGAGKSSLLNSLLDCENLANTASAGAACTCVVTEYHYRQGDDCVIEIERYSLDEIRNQVKDLLLSYRHFHLHRNDLDTRATGEAPDKENEKATENTARLAIDKLKSMFRNHIKDEAFLLANEALDTMYQWVEEAEKLLTTYGENSTGTLDECASTLSRLTSEGPSADDLTIWPFIKKVKVFVDAHILSKGLILVDLPGLRDVNSSRRNITERYVLRCDEIFVVCEMGRVVTDRSVEDVFHLAQQAGISNIGIVCTKSDLFEIEQERNNCRDVQMRRTIEEMISACARDQEIIQRVKDDLRNGDGSDAEEMTVEQKDAQTTLLWKKMRAEKKLEQHGYNIKKYLMAIRAQRIGNQLQEKYGNLAVFFVSKTIYWEARREPRDRAVPRLEVSGILAVRRHCMGMVSESQFALASRFLHSDVDALLGDIELWVRSGAESTTAERTRLVREALEMVERRMRSTLLQRTSELNTISRVFNQEFNDNLYIPGRTQVDAWGAAAARECRQWDGWPHPSYAAFCSNFGHHYTEAVRDHCWNEKIMKAMNESMEPSWKALSTSTKTRMEGIKNIVAQFINWAVDHLSELPHSPDSLEILTDVLLSREHLLVAEIEDAWNDFDNNLRLLRRDATKPMRTSLIGQGMEDAYRAASHESGRGCHNRRKSHITNAASSPQLFLKVLEDSRKEFRGLTSTLENRVRETVAEHAKSIKETLDIVRGENAAREADRDPAYRARVEEEVGRVKKAMRGLVTAGGI